MFTALLKGDSDVISIEINLRAYNVDDLYWKEQMY